MISAVMKEGVFKSMGRRLLNGHLGFIEAVERKINQGNVVVSKPVIRFEA